MTKSAAGSSGYSIVGGTVSVLSDQASSGSGSGTGPEEGKEQLFQPKIGNINERARSSGAIPE